MSPEDRAIAALDAAADEFEMIASQGRSAPPAFSFCSGCPVVPRQAGCDPACLAIAIETDLPL